MADLVTHLCTALLPGAVVGGRWLGVVACGTVLPDALARVIPLGLEQVHLRLVEVPDLLILPWGVLHEPIPLVLACALLSFAFVEEVRAAVFRALLLGCTLHLALDVLQDHHGEGYRLLVPLSLARFELGWIGSEATVPWALPLAGVTAVAWVARLAVGRSVAVHHGGREPHGDGTE